MPSSRVLTELWRKATTSFKIIEQKTEDDDRLPNREELREHQEMIQDIIDVFVATRESNASTVRKEVDRAIADIHCVPMISPSETSSAQSFFPVDTSRTANNRMVHQAGPVIARPLKRKAGEVMPVTEPLHTQKKTKQRNNGSTHPTTATDTNPNNTSASKPPKSKKSRVSLMTPEDDAYIWETYMTHKSMADKLHLSKNARTGLATRLAEKLHTNRQTIGARLKVLKAVHGVVGADGPSRNNATSTRQEADVNSLEGGGINGGNGGISDSDSVSESESGSSSDSDGVSTSSTDSGSESSENRSHGRGNRSHAEHKSRRACKPVAQGQYSSTHNISTSPADPAVPTLSRPFVSAPPRPNTKKKPSPSKHAPQSVTETPLSIPPHITRKSTFTHENDVVLWNAYLRNGCEVLGEGQLRKLAKKLGRNSSSGVSYRVNRLIAEDQKVGIKDTLPVFTTSHDEYILRKYNANKSVSGKYKLSDEALCDTITKKLQIEQVRVYYRLKHLLRLQQSNSNSSASDDNNSDTNSSTSSSNSSDSSTSSSGASVNTDFDIAYNSHYSAPTPRTSRHVSYRYTESEDMAIYTAYLSSTVEAERRRALSQVATTLGRSTDSVNHRLKRLLENQHAVTTIKKERKHRPGQEHSNNNNNSDERSEEWRQEECMKLDSTAPSLTAGGTSVLPGKLSTAELARLKPFQPISPHAGFVGWHNSGHQPSNNDDYFVDSDNNSLEESESESESETPVVKTKAHSATMALRQQLKSLSDSSDSADKLPTPTLQQPPRTSSPFINKLRPPTVPVVPTVPAKQTTPAALAAGARLVGARASAVDTRQECSTSKNDSSSHDRRHFPHDSMQKHTTSYSSKSSTTTIAINSTSELESTTKATTATTATSTITTTTSTATTPVARLPPPSLGPTRVVSTNPHITRFMSTLQKSGMDILYPQTVHDQVLALVLGCLQHLHVTSTHTPQYATVLACLQRCLHRTAHTLPRLQHVTSAQLRSVIVLLQRAECVVLHGGPHVNTSITMRLAGGMKSFLDLRRRHDGYLESQMSENEVSLLQDVLWPIDHKEQSRLQEEMELVVNEVKRVL